MPDFPLECEPLADKDWLCLVFVFPTAWHHTVRGTEKELKVLVC